MRRHSADPFSLVFGLLFAAAGVVLLFGGLEGVNLTWVGPLAAIILGGLLIVTAGSRRSEPDAASDETSTPA